MVTNFFNSVLYFKYTMSTLFENCLLEQMKWSPSSEFGTYHLCEQRRFRRAYAFPQARQNRRCSLIQAVSQEEPSDRKPDPWPLWMAGHARLKFVMTECSKTQIRLMGPIWKLPAGADVMLHEPVSHLIISQSLQFYKNLQKTSLIYKYYRHIHMYSSLFSTCLCFHV